MTNDKINQIIELINNQENYILKIKGQFEVSLSKGFLEDNNMFAINNHIVIMDDHFKKVSYTHEKIHLLCENFKKDLENGVI